MRKKLSKTKKSKNNISFYVSDQELARLRKVTPKKIESANTAGPLERLFATLIDLAPPIFYMLITFIFRENVKFVSGALIGLSHIFGLINFFLLLSRGQTIGKYFRRIRIVDSKTGENAEWTNLIFLRPLPFYVLYLSFLISTISDQPFYSAVPFLLWLIDVLFVFRKDRRCVHDLMAGTKVVYATSSY